MVFAACIALALASCGGSAGGDSEERIIVAALGDSITAGSPAWDPDPAARERFRAAADERSQYEYWASTADPRLEFRNCGVFGERTDQIHARLPECGDGADALVVQGGINDIAQGRPIDDAAANLRRMIAARKAMGLPVAVADVLPWNNGHPLADGAISQLNRLIRRVAREEDVPLLRFHATLEDPQRDGLMRREWTADGDHPSVEGYRRLGERAFRLP